jgi:hypothetical protein
MLSAARSRVEPIRFRFVGQQIGEAWKAILDGRKRGQS